MVDEPPPCHERAYTAVTSFCWEVFSVSYVIVTSIFDVSCCKVL